MRGLHPTPKNPHRKQMTTKAALLKTIRAKCLDCSCYQPTEVTKCAAQACVLWPFRLGRDPSPSRRGFGKNPPASREVLGGKAPESIE